MLILAYTINCEGSYLPVLGENDLYPISITINFRRVNDRHTKNTKMPIKCEIKGEFDFAEVIKRRERILTSDNYHMVSRRGNFLGLTRTINASNNPPTETPFNQEVYDRAVMSLQRDFSDYNDCLNQTLNHNQSVRDNLKFFIGEHAKDNEFISMLVSTNDRRIESLPFEETSFIEQIVSSRPFGVEFKPGRYLTLPPNPGDES
jgi:hypothetical protein